MSVSYESLCLSPNNEQNLVPTPPEWVTDDPKIHTNVLAEAMFYNPSNAATFPNNFQCKGHYKKKIT